MSNHASAEAERGVVLWFKVLESNNAQLSPTSAAHVMSAEDKHLPTFVGGAVDRGTDEIHIIDNRGEAGGVLGIQG